MMCTAKLVRRRTLVGDSRPTMYAARGLIQTGIKGIHDIDRVVALIERRGINIR